MPKIFIASILKTPKGKEISKDLQVKAENTDLKLRAENTDLKLRAENTDIKLKAENFAKELELTNFYIKQLSCINQLEQKKNQEGFFIQSLDELESESEVYKYIFDNAQGNPILHLVLDAFIYSYENNKFSLQGLRNFKYAGGKLIITIQRFSSWENDLIKHSIFNYLDISDKVVFMSKKDQTNALTKAHHHFPREPNYIHIKRRLHTQEQHDNRSLIPRPHPIVSLLKRKSKNQSILVLKLPDPNGKSFSSIIKNAAVCEIRLDIKEETAKEEFATQHLELYTNFIKILQMPAEKRIDPRTMPLLEDPRMEILKISDGLDSRNSGVSKEHPKVVKEETVLNPAERLALKIKAFRAWRDMRLTERQACKNEARSYAYMKKIQGIHIPESGSRNFRNLIKRLKTLEGPYTSEMRSHIETYRKNGFLLPEEKLFIKRLLASGWKLKHVTPYHKDIKNSGNQLLSVYERHQSPSGTKTAHTPSMNGNADNVFFSFGPGDIPTARFLDNINTILEIDYTKIMEDVSESDPEIQHLLQGLWSSDHFYAYGKEQEGEPVCIYGTKYYTNYRKISHDSGCIRWVKQCHFIHPDGNHTIQTIEKGDEIFTHPRIDLALLLLVVEKLRLLGLHAWKSGIAETNLKAAQALVHNLYHPGTFEVHKPRQFLLEHLYVKQIARHPKSTVSSASKFSPSAVLLAAFEGDFNTILSAIDTGFDINTLFNISGLPVMFEDQTTEGLGLGGTATQNDADKKCSMESSIRVKTLNLLAIAIYTGQTILLETLLERGADITVEHELLIPIHKTETIALTPYPTDLISAAALLLNPLFLGRLFNEFIKIGLMKAPGEIKEVSETAIISIRLITEKGSLNKDNRSIRSLCYLDASSNADQQRSIFIYSQMKTQVADYLLKSSGTKVTNACLIASIKRKEPEFLAKILACEIDDIDQPLTMSLCKRNTRTLLLHNGFTPLLSVIEQQNLKMLELLLECNVDVNKPYYALYSDKYPNLRRISEYSGFTPLKFAESIGRIGGRFKHLYPVENSDDHLNRENKHRSEIIRCLLAHKASLVPSNLLATTLISPLPALTAKGLHSVPIYDFYGLLSESLYKIIDQQLYILITMTNQDGKRFFVLNNYKKTNSSLHLCLESVNLDSFYPNKWLSQFKQRIATPFNLKDVHWVDYGQVDFGVQHSYIYYIARFMLCDLGVQPEYCMMPWQAQEYYIPIPESTIHHLYEKGVKSIQYYNADLTDIEAELMCSYKNPDIENITKAYKHMILSKHKLIDFAKKGDIKGIDEILKTDSLLEYTLPLYSPHDKGFAAGEDAPIMISMFSWAMAHEEYDTASYLLEKGFKINNESGIDESSLHRIVAGGAARLYKQLYDSRLKVLLDNIQLHLDSALENEDYVLASVIHKCKKHEEYLQENAGEYEDPMPVTPLFVNLKNAKGREVFKINQPKKNGVCNRFFSKCAIL